MGVLGGFLGVLRVFWEKYRDVFFGFWGFLKVALVVFLVVFARFRSFSGISN